MFYLRPMQISMFDGDIKLKIDKPIRLIELFAGIGAQAKALERIGVPFEHYRICEFDKYAVKSYNAIHGTNFETSDIRTITANDLGIVDTDKYCYIMTYSFPCTDLSVAGKQMGMSKGTQTRSGLLWEVERLLKEMKELPQILLMENVPQVIGQKNIKDFADWIAFLDTLGYKSKWQVLNAKDFNVPQNRERCYMVSALGNYYYEFPCGKGCEKRLKDILEKKVNEKYYLHEKVIFIKQRLNDEDTVAKIILAAMIESEKYGGYEQSRRVYNSNGIAPTLHTCGGGHLELKIIEKNCIRKLTPREYLRLMDFDDEDFDKIKVALISDSQVYKQAGNSIVVAVLQAIFNQML